MAPPVVARPGAAAQLALGLAGLFALVLVFALVEALATEADLAIGGIDASNASAVIEAGARRLCVVRAVRDATDPAAAADELRAAFAPLGEEAPGA